MKPLLNLLVGVGSTLLIGVLAQAQVIAVVGNEKITVKDFDKKYKDVQTQSINPPSKGDFLEDLVRFELGVQEAEKKNLRKDPIVQERIKQEIYKALLEKEIGQAVQNISVNEAEMKSWYKDNPEIRTSHILIDVPQKPTADQQKAAAKRAQEIYAKVKSSKQPFEQMVALYTDDPLSKQTGGDVGWQSRVTLFPEYYEAAMKMKINEVHGLVRTPFGYHIIKLTGRKSYENSNKRQVRTAVFDEKRKAIFNKYFADLKKRYNIQMNKSLIK